MIHVSHTILNLRCIDHICQDKKRVRNGRNMERKNNFLGTEFNLAVVLRTDLETIEKIKDFLASLDNVRIIYQDLDRGKLWIKRGNNYD